MRKRKASSKSVDWTPPEEIDAYTSATRLLEDAAVAVQEVVDAYHIHADTSVREEFSDRIGKLGGLADALKDAAEESASMVTLISNIRTEMEAERARHHGTRAISVKEDAVRAAEDVRTSYVSKTDHLFTGITPSWLAVPNSASEQLKRTCSSAISQESALIKMPERTRTEASSQLNAVISTAVGRGDFQQHKTAAVSDGKPSPLADLSAPLAQAHRVAAALDAQFSTIGWKAPLAVAVIERQLGEDVEHKTVYTTTDGLAIWPEEVLLPTDTYPATYLRPQGASDIKHLLGQALPVAKLLNSLDDGWDVKGLATTDIFDTHLSSNPECIQDSALTRALKESGEIPPCTVRREDLAEVKTHQAVAVFNRVRQSLGSTVSLEEAIERLVGARWLGTDVPRGYIGTYIGWLLSDSHAALRAGNPLGATWPLTELEDLTT